MKPVVGRLHAQGLDAPRFGTASDVVSHLGCVQSQLHDMALWAVGRRTDGLTFAELQGSFARGEFLRTHVLRPTWHFVDPGDVHWWLALTAPRIRRLMRAIDRDLGLTDERLDRCAEVVVASLAGRATRTRAELGADLAAAGLDHTGQSLAHVVMHAEIDALIVNGPPRGKQHTYRLLEPRPMTRTHDELLADAARRYARGHGPVRDKDLAWWTSLTLTDARRAIELADLTPLDVDGVPHWRLDDPVEAEVPRVMLLSSFDEYVSYAREPADYSVFAGAVKDVMRGSGLLMLDGRLAGTWTRTVSARAVDVVVEAAGLDGATQRSVEAEAALRAVPRPRGESDDRHVTGVLRPQSEAGEPGSWHGGQNAVTGPSLPADRWGSALPC
ncbi:winged helix DNA-binding domain-containing protein [Aeromicrobium chenweiae]|uniref:Uncharacterized protein n=1 Tax=Aeromicrobium chenweiae TaxID=2079793 RepID=A0A2S0WNR6_9ACTN|nr:winged helix DNA-binding domain-containing protein [Aeromicrobium chenweiae]AWB92975.1 hypothetical protein C3E78_12600 [Aeromicrobium chenweiae]TGN33969.1 winged helix DNA-binding domain-containing protein [Aeromicrobium chenweiae]